MSREVRITNTTRGTVLAERCRVASSWTERMVGLLRSPQPPRAEGLLIERTSSIHMWFMRYPLDVVFFDSTGRVTKTVAGLRPWRVVLWAPGSRDCVELGVGSIAASGTAPGDVLEVAAADQRRNGSPTRR